MGVAELTGKRAIVTGASSGIGRATAAALAAAGASVAGGARRVERLETEIALELDVTDAASSSRFVEEAVERLGGLDILVNNAGLALGRAPFDESSEEDEATVFGVNVGGLVRMSGSACRTSATGVHREHGLGRRPRRLRGRRLVRGGEVRRARLHVRAARGSPRPAVRVTTVDPSR